MPDRHLALDIDVCEKRALVVYSERENAVLVGDSEGGAEEGAVWGLSDGCKREAVKG